MKQSIVFKKEKKQGKRIHFYKLVSGLESLIADGMIATGLSFKRTP